MEGTAEGVGVAVVPITGGLVVLGLGGGDGTVVIGFVILPVELLLLNKLIGAEGADYTFTPLSTFTTG